MMVPRDAPLDEVLAHVLDRGVVIDAATWPDGRGLSLADIQARLVISSIDASLMEVAWLEPVARRVEGLDVQGLLPRVDHGNDTD